MNEDETNSEIPDQNQLQNLLAKLLKAKGTEREELKDQITAQRKSEKGQIEGRKQSVESRKAPEEEE